MQLQDGEQQMTETITTGNYFKKGEKHYVLYEEIVDGFTEPVSNMIKFEEGILSVQKKGPVSSLMVFEEKKKNLSNYVTPFGTIMIGVDAKKVKYEEQDNFINVDVEYALEMNYEHLADCSLRLNIQSQKAAKLVL